MPRHPFDPISAVLGILAVTTGLFVLLGAPVDVDNHGGGWIAVLIGLIGLAIIPWHRPRRDPGPWTNHRGTTGCGPARQTSTCRCRRTGHHGGVPVTGDVYLPPSGEQFELRCGVQQAVVTEVGATLRHYSLDGECLIDGFDVDEMASGGRGQVLAPWPNRLGNGRYTFEGQAERVPLNEPARANAIHGLVRWLSWTPVTHSTEAVRLRCVLAPQPAYQWRLALEIEYRLGETGLSVEATASNLAASRAPFGIGFHPYLTVGTTTVDDAVLSVPGRRRLLVDDHGLPVGDAAVAGTPFDFTQPRPIGAAVLDTAFTDLAATGDGRGGAVLSDAAGRRRVTLWMGPDFRYLMVFTGDTLEPHDRRRRAVAMEPMTCPPDALRSGRDLIALDPGAEWSGTWGLDPFRIVSTPGGARPG